MAEPRGRMKVVVSRDPAPRKAPEPKPEPGPQERTLPVRRRWLVIGAVGLAMALAGWHYLTLYTSMTGAKDDLVSVRERLDVAGFEAEQADIDAASDNLDSAESKVNRARRHYRLDPVIRVAGWLPRVGDQVDAAGKLLDISATLVDLGQEATVAAQTAVDLRDNREEGRPLTQSLVDALAEASPQIGRINELTAKAVEQRRELGDGALWSPLNNARRQLDEDLPGLASSAGELAQAAQVLPAFLGFEGDRRYLVLALNNGELLPGGGLVTAAGVVTVTNGENGAIGFADSNGWLPAAQAMGIPYIEPPGPLKRYLLRDYSWNLLVSNWDPDFPTWAQQALEFYELVNGPQDVDGVVAVDLVVLEQILRITGPKTMDVPEIGRVEFTPENAVYELERMTRPAFIIEAEDRKSIIGDLAETLIADLQQLPSERWDEAVRTIRRMGSERHIQLFSFNDAEQALIADVEWDGRLHVATADYLHFNEASVLSTKLNLIIHPHGSLNINVTELGDVDHELKLTYSNGLDLWAADKDDDLVTKLMMGGLYGGYLRVFANRGMTNLDVDIDGAHGNIEDTGREETADWFGTLLPVQANETREVAFRWRTTPPGTSTSYYELHIQKQAGTVGLCIDLNVSRDGEAADSLSVEGGSKDAEGRWCLTSDITVRARF